MKSSIFPTTQIVEPGETSWGKSYKPVGCLHCKQVFLVPTNYSGKVCPNCGYSELSPQPALLRTEPPELLIPYQKNLSDLSPILSSFIKGVWLHSDDFNLNSLLSHIVPVFWPMWLVDSDLNGNWQAEIGFDYQVKSSQESYRDNGWHSREVLENRIRWEPRLGKILRHYDNVISPAVSNSIHLRNFMGDYHLDQAIPYKPNQIQGQILRIPDVPPEDAWPTVQSGFNQLACKNCSQAAKGEHIRNFTIHAIYDNLHWTLLFLPMFMSYYNDDAGLPHPVLINGQTGVIGGLRLASQKKGWKIAAISIGIAIGFLLLSLLCFLLSAVLPILLILGFCLIVLSFLMGLLAIIPAIWPWQWNRKHQGV